MLEIAEIRKQLRHAIDRAKRSAADRRAQAETASRQYDRFLEDIAVPVFKMFATALRAEGFPFGLSTPQGKVRLVSERALSDFLEIDLDVSQRPSAVIGRAVHTRGRQITTIERPLRETGPKAISDLADEDVLAFLLAVIEPFVER